MHFELRDRKHLAVCSQGRRRFQLRLCFLITVAAGNLRVSNSLVFFQVTCSYLQIYQERVYDLLGPEKSGPEVFLREHPKKGIVHGRLGNHGLYSNKKSNSALYVQNELMKSVPTTANSEQAQGLDRSLQKR